ncbi:MAG: 2-amino-4-hydroxy-6-hydroxymethyldihydropteridine diphosphokinase [Gemmatimonadota bacterium]|nr:2-amino-4-hydroxy-6-hydroxymethyldihydropteridine diphosphokinase [Gemmatimonadota bacterium]
MTEPTHPEWAFVALGSNLGDRARHLADARAALATLPGTELVAVSQIEETEPVGAVSQPDYLNQMALLRTRLAPHALLDACLRIERSAGRVRRIRWGPRTLDLDIVRYGDAMIAEPGLAIPHPAINDRPFWQRELAELTPHVRHD